MGDLTNLIDQAIPSGRQGLQECSSNLERVAAYCEANYLQVANKAAALEETKRYAVQSLASVAYQINTLANNLLQALDFECSKIAQLESFVNAQAQEISIHKEKVARREIGVLTTNRSVPRYHQIVAPAQQEKGQRYIRQPVDYSMLDDIGHGLKTNSQPNSALSVGRTSGSSSNSANSNYLSFPISNYSVSPVSKVGSISKNTGKEYRTPVTISPPTAPQVDHMQISYPGMVQIEQMNQKVSRNEAASVYGSTGCRRESQEADCPAGVAYDNEEQSARISASLNLPYPSLTFMGQQSPVSSDILPPMPPDSMLYASQFGVNTPPIPSDDYATRDESVTLRRPYSAAQSSSDEWIPKSYIEKVTAIYDYTAEKPDELSFRENAIIYVVRKNDDGWYEGVMDGVTGLFPGNYVEPCS